MAMFVNSLQELHHAMMVSSCLVCGELRSYPGVIYRPDMLRNSDASLEDLSAEESVACVFRTAAEVLTRPCTHHEVAKSTSGGRAFYA